MKMSRTRLHLIRHGEAYSNIRYEGKVVSGMKGDKGLTPLGVTQVERLRDRLLATGELATDVVLASTLPRARQTAEILAPVWEAPIISDDDLHELRPGEADGLLRDVARERYGKMDFRQQPYHPKSPGGETWGWLRQGRCSQVVMLALSVANHAGGGTSVCMAKKTRNVAWMTPPDVTSTMVLPS